MGGEENLEQELSKKERRRESETTEDERQVRESRRIKKLKYSRLRDGWGATMCIEEETSEQAPMEESMSTLLLGEELLGTEVRSNAIGGGEYQI